MQLHTDHKNLNICTIIHILRLHCVHLVNVTLTLFPRSRRLRRPTPCLLSKRLRGHTVFEQNSISIVPLLFKLVFAGVGMRGGDRIDQTKKGVEHLVRLSPLRVRLIGEPAICSDCQGCRIIRKMFPSI